MKYHVLSLSVLQGQYARVSPQYHLAVGAYLLAHSTLFRHDGGESAVFFMKMVIFIINCHSNGEHQ